MNLSALCLQRPIATLLIWISVIVAGAASWRQLPIGALPEYDTPTIQVNAKLPGASPETVSASLATVLEKQFSAIPSLLAITSTSLQGEAQIALEFDPSRNIDAAAGDVQAALFRANRLLPAEMTTPPSYKKVNPADLPILTVGLSSTTLKLTELNAYSDNLLVPAISTLKGVAQVMVAGQKRYAVRISVDPLRLAAMDLALAEVAAALKAANSNAPLGELDGRHQVLTLESRGGLMKAADFAGLTIAVRQGRGVRLADVATVEDSIENTQSASAVNGESAILLTIQRQPGANTVATVDAIRALLPRLRAQMPASVTVALLTDRSVSVRDAIHDVNLTMLLTVALVVLVILLFLRHWSATFIPSVSLPVSVLGTFALMQVFGLSLNNISLMGLTIAVGLIVDDAIVVLENIMRHIEHGEAPLAAAMRGAREVGFTVISISVSLVAVFIPIFFMPGTIGLLFHEFAIVVSLSILVSAAVALTLIPILVPMLLKNVHAPGPRPAWSRAFERLFDATLAAYARALDWSLAHRAPVLAAGLLTFALTAWLYASAPKGFFPQEDIGQVSANVSAPQDMSYAARLAAMRRLEAIMLAEPAIRHVVSRVDHDSNVMILTLKERDERPAMDAVLARLRKDANVLPGVQVFFSPVQNLKIGARAAKSAYQYTLQSVDPAQLDAWSERLMAELRKSDVFTGLNSDLLKQGLQARLAVDRDKAALLGVDMANIRNTLYAAYGARQVSTIYAPEDSYQVIMELPHELRRDEADLGAMHVRANSGALVPLSAVTTVDRARGTLAINHQGQLQAVTISFDLAPGHALSEAAAAIEAAKAGIGLPPTVFGGFAGQAALFQQSQGSQLWLIVVAIAVIYVVLGVLYESWIHPVTILLGIPSAAVGALLALRLAGLELTFIAMIGILLLVGIVKKNAIMMIDFALETRRAEGVTAARAIRQACLLRFRPIMMTTLCAIVGALPIALGLGAGAELRQPLGVAVVGGLLFSQLITLLLTPVLFLWFDGMGARRRNAAEAAPAGTAA